MFTKQNTPLPFAERYDAQYEKQQGVCASCGTITYFPWLIIPTMTFTSQIVPGAPDELLCTNCAAALQKAQKSVQQRREAYIRKHISPQ